MITFSLRSFATQFAYSIPRRIFSYTLKDDLKERKFDHNLVLKVFFFAQNYFFKFITQPHCYIIKKLLVCK